MYHSIYVTDENLNCRSSHECQILDASSRKKKKKTVTYRVCNVYGDGPTIKIQFVRRCNHSRIMSLKGGEGRGGVPFGIAMDYERSRFRGRLAIYLSSGLGWTLTTVEAGWRCGIAVFRVQTASKDKWVPPMLHPPLTKPKNIDDESPSM